MPILPEFSTVDKYFWISVQMMKWRYVCTKLLLLFVDVVKLGVEVNIACSVLLTKLKKSTQIYSL